MSRPAPIPEMPLRVVVADDSALMRRMLSDALEGQGCAVVGVASNGDEALGVCARLRPDVLSLDLAMPGLDGIGVLRALRDQASPIPVVVVSAFSPAHGARAVDALAEGAIELVAKPGAGMPMQAFVAELGEKVRAAASSRVRAHVAAPRRATPAPRGTRTGGPRPVVIACSTGGPKALADLLPMLPARVGAGTLVVQHMPAGFTGSLAARLDRTSRLHVSEAAAGDVLDPGRVYVAPGGRHLRIGDGGALRLTHEPEIGGLRPRADLTIKDAAARWGSRTLLVVLTGMGRDGLEGARDLHIRGGRILVEAESTCTVYGMPRAIAEAELADRELPLPELAAAIVEEAG
ncbi:MAG TPA: chemotaxis-specific protein-glutamate methyltransferase CheB [Gaiellales bacterium]|nr:chemotaxis-specific protein-glutamate methyltransferase CheB [Gaiellales bacterium]